MLSRLNAFNRCVWAHMGLRVLFQSVARWTRLAGSAVLLLMALAVSFSGVAHAEEEFLDPAEAFVLSAAMANPTEVHVHFRIAPDYYMYRERFGIEADTAVLGEPIYPRGTVKYDPTF